MSNVIPSDRIESKIHELRGIKVMLDRDLAERYRVETRTLNQAVTRNIGRFPEDFMLKLTEEEAKILRSQNVILKRGQFSKYPPKAFTEHGILMLSNVLKSERAIDVSIQIIRVFNRMRQMIQDNREILKRLEALEKRFSTESRAIWGAIKSLRREMIGE